MWAAGLALAVAIGGAACRGDDARATEDTIAEVGSPNPGPLPTLEGGIELPATDVTTLLTGEGLTYGSPLPSQAAAAAAYEADPEVGGTAARTVRGGGSGARVADLVLLRLDGKAFFDQGSLDAFVKGLMAAAGGVDAIAQPVGDVTTYTAIGSEQTAAGYQIGDLVVLVTAPTAQAARAVVDRQLAARAAGAHGPTAPATRLIPTLPIDGAFVAVPSVSFVAFPPPEEEDPPATPVLPRATGFQGRYGVVAGERRTTVWAYSLDPAAYPTAEALAPALQGLVSSLAGGTKAATTEVIDRVVYAADPPADASPPDPTDPTEVEPLVARAFVHGSLAIVVTGRHADEVDAAISDWISTLAAR